MTEQGADPAPRGRGGQTAYDALRGQIVGGALSPNERLVENDLAAVLGFGRAAVRAALTRLEADGLVVREPNRGARVRMVTETEAVEIVQARSVLEALGAAHAAERASDEEIAAMQRVLAEMGARVASGDLLAYSDGNAQLHQCVLQASHHTTVQRLIAGLRAQTVRFQYRTILVPGRAARSLVEHTRVVEAIAARDAAAAEQAMKQHLTGVSEALHSTARAGAGDAGTRISVRT